MALHVGHNCNPWDGCDVCGACSQRTSACNEGYGPFSVEGESVTAEKQLVDIRQKLYSTYMELAEQASTRRQWEAASAFQYAASLALGLAVTSIEVRTSNEP
jgi:hypothetical protein